MKLWLRNSCIQALQRQQKTDTDAAESLSEETLLWHVHVLQEKKKKGERITSIKTLLKKSRALETQNYLRNLDFVRSFWEYFQCFLLSDESRGSRNHRTFDSSGWSDVFSAVSSGFAGCEVDGSAAAPACSDFVLSAPKERRRTHRITGMQMRSSVSGLKPFSKSLWTIKLNILT